MTQFSYLSNGGDYVSTSNPFWWWWEFHGQQKLLWKKLYFAVHGLWHTCFPHECSWSSNINQQLQQKVTPGVHVGNSPDMVWELCKVMRHISKSVKLSQNELSPGGFIKDLQCTQFESEKFSQTDHCFGPCDTKIVQQMFSKWLNRLGESDAHSLSFSTVSKSLKVFESGGKTLKPWFE